MSATQISFVDFALAEQALCTPSVTLPAAAVAAPRVAADGGECIRPVRRSWLVLVTFDSGLSRSFRWYKRADALRCMRDFGSARKQLFCCYGRLTWDGWRDVSPPLLDRVAV